ncbi:MAG: hypothetical protein ACRCXD_14870, partial [Luteolibacter sp.]
SGHPNPEVFRADGDDWDWFAGVGDDGGIPERWLRAVRTPSGEICLIRRHWRVCLIFLEDEDAGRNEHEKKEN